MSSANDLDQVKALIQKHFASIPQDPFEEGKTPMPLSVPTYGWEEVWEALDSLLTTRVTIGAKVRRFESLFAEYVGVKHAVMVNSGSSANLLAVSVVTSPTLKNAVRPGDEVITPAVTWATTVYPIVQCGLTPVLVDVGRDTFNIDPAEIEKAISPRTRAIVLVHLLGNPCDMTAIMAIARKHNLLVIEDCCEAHGAEHRGTKVGRFGDLATFSFFFSHHISTIEGGMVVTNRDDYAEVLREMRAFGWVRDAHRKEALARQYPDIDPRFLFVNTGYNVRPTEVQGAFGIHQIKRLEGYIQHRKELANYWNERLSAYAEYLTLANAPEGSRHVWFLYPIMVKPNAPFTRAELAKFLESNGVETRPILAGNMEEQPVMRLINYRKLGDLPAARAIMRHGLCVGIHHGITPARRDAFVKYVSQFIDQVARTRKAVRH
ncbi:MAG: aminotransferase class V-fold PLP-dependent enzyme [Chloroflexi bacterium]|nr:aminotransferase class V-fold PLP-dependent enzyme [Chloroflexota bacterium]